MKFSDTKSDKKWELPQHYPSLKPYERAQVRNQYVKEQDGLCHYCAEPLSGSPSTNYTLDMRRFPRNFLRYPIHLHHCHQTGLTLGAVHALCNGILWEVHGE